MDLDSNPDILLVRKHLVEHLGPPDEVYEVRGSPIPTSPIQALHLSYFAPGGPEAPVVFATCGACLYQMNDGRRVEAMMLFRKQPSQEAIASIHRLLSSFAIFAEANNEAVRIGDVVRAPDDLHRFCDMDAILFLPPVPFVESFHRIPLTNNKGADIIWLLPVYEAEAKYALENGPQALMMLFAAQGLDLTETDRDEANTMIRPEDARTLAEKRSEEERKKAESQPRPAQPRKPPPQRKNLGAGSFEVADQGDAVAITRRGAKPAKPKPERPLSVVPPPEEEPPPPQQPPPRPGMAPQQRRKPLLAPAPQPKEVRFDMNTGEQTSARVTPAPSGPAQRKPIVPAKPAAQPAKPAPPPKEPDTPEARAEAKRKRIEELKAKAADAAKRAAERTGGGGEEKP